MIYLSILSDHLIVIFIKLKNRPFSPQKRVWPQKFTNINFPAFYQKSVLLKLLKHFLPPRKKAAHKLYTNLGYTVYRTILNYYGGGTGAVGEENAYDMRKSMSKDVNKETTIPLKRPVTADEIEWH